MPKNSGTLTRNATLISKWIYRFSNERESLWRRVVCAKSGINPTTKFPYFNKSTKKSSLLNLIGPMLERNKHMSNVVQEEFKKLTWNGFNADFWVDDWICFGALKDIFPHIFALAVAKNNIVCQL